VPFEPFCPVDTVLLFTFFYRIVSVLMNKIFIHSFIHSSCPRGRRRTIDATTAEKLEETSRGVDADLLPFPPSSLPRLLLLLPPIFHPFPSLVFFPSPVTFSKEVRGSIVSCLQCPAKNDSQLQKLEGTKYTCSRDL